MWKERENLYNIGSPAYHNKAMLGRLKFQVFPPQIKYDNRRKVAGNRTVCNRKHRDYIQYDLFRAIFCLVVS